MNTVLLTHTSGCPILQYNVEVTCEDSQPCPETALAYEVEIGEAITVCPADLGITEEVVSMVNRCAQSSGTLANVEIEEGTFCITIEGLLAGTEVACMEINTASGCQLFTMTLNIVDPDVDCPPLFNTDEISEFTTDCDDLVSVCLDLELAVAMNYSIYVNGDDYTTSLQPCTDGTLIDLPVGLNEVVFENDVTGCLDTLIADIACLNPDIMTDTIFVNGSDTLCVDITELPGTPISMNNDCGENSGDFVSFTLIEESYCVIFDGLDIGQESACIVVCDDLGFCDTTLIVVTVIPREAVPTAEPDNETTLINTPIVINVLQNDTIQGGADTIYIAQDPMNGQVEILSDMTIEYTPDEDYCSSVVPDEFIYVICNENGCDTALVTVYVLCDELRIYTGFSPNFDGVNDTFVIEGASLFPDNELSIFNRWGNRVYNTTNYANDWGGTWNGNDLPDGTYFYVFEDGNGNVYSGYVQIHR